MKITELKAKINSGDNAVFESLYGTEAEVRKAQAERYEALLDDFKATFEKDDAEMFSSPGRTEIGGNHTDHQHGRVLAGAVNLDNIAVAAPNGTNVVRIKSAGYDMFEANLDELVIDEAMYYTSPALIKGIAARLKELDFQVAGFDACIHGCVPKGSGLSSSASFEVLIGAIFSELFNDGKLDPVENAKIGQWSENNYFGKPCGLMDQTACSVGGLITIDFKDPAAPIVKEVDFDFTKTGYHLVITDVGGGHDDPASQQEYGSLPSEMKSVAKELDAEVLREVTMDQIVEGIPAMRGKVSDRALMRAYHFQGDNARVVEQVAALEAGEFDKFQQLVIESGYSSFMYNQNIFDVLHKDEQVVSLGLALSEMVLKGKGAWRVHGGGFGGTIQAFVPDAALAEYTRVLEHVFGEGKCHKLFIRNEGSIRLAF